MVALLTFANTAFAQFMSQQDACMAGMEQARQLDGAAWDLQRGIGYDLEIGRRDRACEKSQMALRFTYQSAQATATCGVQIQVNSQQAIETATDSVQNLCQGQ
jgi:hypothetical protein